MSKAASYVVVGVLAFLIGGFSFQLVGRTGQENADSKSAEGRTTAAVSREFAIEGMSCQGCVDAITLALTQLPGVQSAKVSLADKRAVVWANESETPTEKILAAVTAAGYQARLAPASQSALVAASASAKPPVLVSITRGKNELHAVSMAIGLAQSAIKDGRSAVVFLSVEAPIFAAKNLGDDVKHSDFPPIKKMLADTNSVNASLDQENQSLKADVEELKRHLAKVFRRK